MFSQECLDVAACASTGRSMLFLISVVSIQICFDVHRKFDVYIGSEESLIRKEYRRTTDGLASSSLVSLKSLILTINHEGNDLSV